MTRQVRAAKIDNSVDLLQRKYYKNFSSSLLQSFPFNPPSFLTSLSDCEGSCFVLMIRQSLLQELHQYLRPPSDSFCRELEAR